MMTSVKKPLIIIAGPTAIGKSDISVKLAKRINGEIISADSMQVYKGMDIGTAKITENEMDGIKHYLIDVLDPKDDFNIVYFQTEAKKAIEEIYNKGKIPIIAGGTGFYIQSIIYDIDFGETTYIPEYRQELMEIIREKGPEYLHEQLRLVDERAAELIHYNDHKRVIRALEYYKQTGKPISDHNEAESNKESIYNFAYFVLNDDRERIYERIDKRVDQMVESGLVNEVKILLSKGLSLENVSMKGLGYKEIINYLNGLYDLDEAVRIIKRDTRHFAKRQITWFKREKEVIFINKEAQEAMLEKMLKALEDKKII